MCAVPQSYLDRLEAGITFRWGELPARVDSPADCAPETTTLCLQRSKASYRGLGRLRDLKVLLAYQVDQGFLNELCELPDLETLYLESVTATDLRALTRLKCLRRLVINSATRIGGLEWATSLAPTLEALALENVKKIRNIEPLAALPQLRVLAVEGSLHASMKVASLLPLSRLERLEYLFLTALRVEDKKLAPLATLARLKVVEFADYYAAGEIDSLARALPNTRCSWFEERMKKHRWEHRRRSKRT